MKTEERESYTLAAYVWYLWEKRVGIILGAILCMALMVVYVQFLAREKFRSYAQLMIKEPRKFTDTERDAITPLSYKVLLLNDNLLKEVRDEFCKVTGLSPFPLAIEKFRQAFEVKTEIVKDTSVKIEYSPVISISADAGTAQFAQKLMEIWVRRFMDRCGDILAREADFATRSYLDKAENLKKTLTEKETALLKMRWELPFRIRRLTAKEMLLAPTSITWEFRDERPSYYKYRDQTRVDFSMIEPATAPAMVNGLEQQLVQVDVELAAARAGNNPSPIAALEAKRNTLLEKVKQTNADIAIFQKDTAELEARFQTLAREVTSLRDEYSYVMDLKNQADVEAHGLTYSNKGDGRERSDIIILSPPSLPELRIFPKKTIFCLIAGVVGFFLTTLLFIFEKFMKDGKALLEKVDTQ